MLLWVIVLGLVVGFLVMILAVRELNHRVKALDSAQEYSARGVGAWMRHNESRIDALEQAWSKGDG